MQRRAVRPEMQKATYMNEAGEAVNPSAASSAHMRPSSAQTISVSRAKQSAL